MRENLGFTLSNGLELRFKPHADLYLPALLQGLLGAAGGRVRSAAKAEAARTNGKLGGRPRKAAVT